MYVIPIPARSQIKGEEDEGEVGVEGQVSVPELAIEDASNGGAVTAGMVDDEPLPDFDFEAAAVVEARQPASLASTATVALAGSSEDLESVEESGQGSGLSSESDYEDKPPAYEEETSAPMSTKPHSSDSSESDYEI